VYCTYSFYAVVVYSFVAHWVWADDGWLLQLGVHDFAGGGPVHLLGAVNGFVAILFVGARHGRFDGSRPESDFAPSSQTSMLFGLFMLWWGWIGFNCGSSFGITKQKWLVATRAGVTTINSTAGGGIAALLYTQIKSKGKHVQPGDVVNGILGALVAITPTCAVVHTYDAIIIGFIGAIVALISNDWFLRIQIDDPVGALGVHGVAAIWGILAVGLFADSTSPGVDVADGLFRVGGWHLLAMQLLSVVAIIGWGCACSAPFFYMAGIILSRDERDPRKGLRMPLEEEIAGADKHFHGYVAPTRGVKRSEGSRRLQLDKNDLPEEIDVSGEQRPGPPRPSPPQSRRVRMLQAHPFRSTRWLDSSSHVSGLDRSLHRGPTRVQFDSFRSDSLRSLPTRIEADDTEVTQSPTEAGSQDDETLCRRSSFQRMYKVYKDESTRSLPAHLSSNRSLQNGGLEDSPYMDRVNEESDSSLDSHGLTEAKDIRFEPLANANSTDHDNNCVVARGTREVESTSAEI